jgi:radical SAM superfamily enzyme YgiQ (UPF0313 family)
MKILLTALNARFSHTNLAIRYLRNSLKENGFTADIYEATINDREALILRELYLKNADIYCFSAYIWNIEKLLWLALELKKIKPKSIIIFGGPEVSFDNEELIKKHPFIDYIICGEGENKLVALINEVMGGNIQYSFEYKNPYMENEIVSLKDKIIYYETSRGCPFNCSYCLSGREGGVRFFDVQKVKSDLAQIALSGVRLVKFVDRSFNCNSERAYELFSYLKDIKGETKFHFEICADLLREKDFTLLASVPKEKFQFEIGVQSTNEKTLAEISRNFDIHKTLEKIKKLKCLGNIHIHSDLIAGLPFEDFNSFKASFDTVFPVCDVLQLGFLKVLKGSAMLEKANEYGLNYTNTAPYEILSNNWLSFGELLKLKDIEEALERFSNSGSFQNGISFLLENEPSPFEFFKAFAEFLDGKKALHKNISKKDDYILLYDFAKQRTQEFALFAEYLRLDFITNMRGEPPFEYAPYPDRFLKACREFFSDENRIKELLPQHFGATLKNINKYCDIHLFNFRKKSVLLFERQSGTIVDISFYFGAVVS